jgi:DNA-binding LacI/PurR family transcriptional regulator
VPDFATSGTGAGAGWRRRPGSRDVARAAGVSQKTVSRVMNGELHVTQEVRLRVLRASEELGYRPNHAARALISGRTHQIGVATLTLQRYGSASTLAALQRAARNAGYSIVVNSCRDRSDGLASAIDSLVEQGVDGIVLCEPIDEQNLTLDVGIPILSLGRFPGPCRSKVISMPDNGAANARAATEHLLSLGHSTVWHIAGPQRWWSARDRLVGWREALRDAAVVEPPWLEGDWSPESGYAAGAQLAQKSEVSAIFVASDDMAVGVLRALADAGRTVPADVSVVGFDDIPLAQYQSPPLTTIRQDFDGMAGQGLRRLVRQIEGSAHEPPAPEQPPPPRLAVRLSTSAPAQGRRGTDLGRGPRDDPEPLPRGATSAVEQ